MIIHMKKLLLSACLLAGTMAWAAQPAQVVRAYNNPDGGYVILDADNEIVAFSETGAASADNQPLAALLGENGMKLQVMQERLPQNIATDAELEIVVAPLLGDIAYNQGRPYNNMAPMGVDDKGKEKRCVTGCVATAMAQIMAYWKYPEKCNPTGEFSYTTSTQGIKMKLNYDTIAFDWSQILPKYEGVESTAEQRHQIALLMLACGVSVKMNYTPSSSGSVSMRVPDAFIEQFGYQKGLRFEGRDDTSKFPTEKAFLQALMDEFDNKRPVYCSATYNGDDKGSFDGGHAFVIDGYAYATTNTKKDKPYFHFNWGWGGTDQVGNPTLWYRLNGSTDKSPYSSAMQIVRYIMPATQTPVEETMTDNRNDGRIFDILGHEVKETVPGQLYIRNGRKFIAR